MHHSTRQSAVHGLGWCVEQQLIEGEVQPSTELEPDLGQRSYVPESKTFVQCDAPCIGGVDTADHAMDFAGSRSRDQLLHNYTTKTLTSVVFVDVD